MAALMQSPAFGSTRGSTAGTVARCHHAPGGACRKPYKPTLDEMGTHERALPVTNKPRPTKTIDIPDNREKKKTPPRQ